MSSADDQAASAADGTTPDALIASLETLLDTARTQLGELRTTLTTAMSFAQTQDHPQ
jgi:hypothetical protein